MKGHDESRCQGRILVMDDEPGIREILRDILIHLGYQVETAADGESACRQYSEAFCRDERFDAVIIDLTINGGMGGEEALQELQKIDPSVKAIVSSGHSGNPVMADPRSYGFSGVMPKPYRIKDMGQLLDEILSHR
ncbi:DNA-binding NtrC family response regulator [Methanolinea mesophila]|uniref:response regulator n=1 Tax=Methanolinea mesophila TaxID=547055 RepID=UPI001AEB94DF|nr:response regulator [Methanolinea mesophila]MBP1928431.1 DNA-binding NtrC family response regulator [Methanolinea mesophila]